MSENVVFRQSRKGGELHYRTKEGGWSRKQDDALRTSEEDAKAIVRRLRLADLPPALFSYDYKEPDKK